jgi:four helix bundle protein
MKDMVGSKNGARTRHYRDLLVWQKAMGLARAIYGETEALPKAEMYGLQAQMRRAAVSIPSNIAEGHGRLDDGHFRQSLATSRGSLFELQTQLELAGDLELVSEDTVRHLMKSCEEVARLINGLLGALETA